MDIDNVYCGDCVEVMKRIPDNFIDLTITSPPYDEIRSYKGYTFDFENIASELYRVIKDGGVVVWVVGDSTINGSESGTSFKQALHFKDVCGFNIHDTMIYKKKAISFPSNTRYHQCFEYMFVFSKEQPKTFNPLKDKVNVVENKKRKSMSQRQKSGETVRQNRNIAMADYGMRWNVWEYITGWMHNSKDKEAFEHPATFPEALAEDHILSWSNEGDVVLDPMCGSGTTPKMSAKNNRHYLAIDVSDYYCKIAIKRIEKAKQELKNMNKYKVFF